MQALRADIKLSLPLHGAAKGRLSLGQKVNHGRILDFIMPKSWNWSVKLSPSLSKSGCQSRPVLVENVSDKWPRWCARLCEVAFCTYNIL